MSRDVILKLEKFRGALEGSGATTSPNNAPHILNKDRTSNQRNEWSRLN